MSSDRFDDNQNLPPWLRDVPLPPRPRANEPAPKSAVPPFAASTPASNEPADALPDWLRDTGSQTANASSPAAPAGSKDDLPSWLREFDGAAPAASTQSADAPPAQATPSQSSGAGALPDWLQDLGPASAPPTPPRADDEPVRSDVPDWLREVQDAAPPTTSTPPATTPDPPAPPSETLPGWLADLADNTAEGEAPAAPDWLNAAGPSTPSAPQEDALPSWLRPEAPATPPASDTALPGWLQPEASSAPAPAPNTSPTAGDEEDDTLPGWLRSTPEEITSSPDLAPFTLDETAGQTPPPARSWLSSELETSDDMPSWLQSADNRPEPSAPPPTSTPTAPEPSDSAAPPWLSEASSESSAGDVPSWLSETISAAPEQPSGDVPDWLAGAANSAPEQPSGDVPDWLAGAANSAPEQPSSDVPDWLAGAANSAPEQPGGDVPSWLQDTAPAAPELPASDVPSWLSETASTIPEPPTGDVPSWLQDTAPAAPAPAQPSSDQLPEWLRNTAAEEKAPPASDEVPAWLRDQPSDAAPAPGAEAAPSWLGAADTTAPDATTEVPSDASDKLPGWLQDSAPAASPAAPLAADDLPTWLRPAAPPASPDAPPASDDLPPWLRDDVGQPLPAAGPAGDSKLPSWLQGANTDATPAAPVEEPVAPAGNGWLGEPAATPAQADSLVGGVELPPWLRPPESETAKEEINPTDARSLDWLTRLGAQEEEEAEVATAPATRLRPPALPQRSAAQIEAIALLEQLAAEPFPASAAAEAAPLPAIWRRIGLERLLYVVLALAVILALLTPAPNFLGMNDPPSAPGAADLFAQIDKLGANDIVLVGYEWDARRSGELRPLEQAVFDHLIAHQVKLVLISTDPQGSLLLYDLREKLGVAGYKPQGEDYILLGYKPGAELALRAMAQNFPATLMSDFQGNDASGSVLATTPDHQQRLKSPGDFSMVLVLSDEASDVQGWMEQVRPSAQRADSSYVPFAFVLPAETAPIVQPYLDQPNVLHLAGKQGALAYQQQSGTATAQVSAETSQLRFSLLLYLALLIAGALAVGIYSAAARGRSRK